MARFVLCTKSSTQRIVVEIQDSSTILLTKEWRRTSHDEWVMGKGITIPITHLIELGKVLSQFGTVDENQLLSGYELLQEGKYDSTTSRGRTPNS